METRLDHDVALVTGASGGLGSHFAEMLAGAGAKVALGARRTDKLADVAQRIEAADGRALPVELDVTDAASVARAVDVAETELGAITILVNNAGIVVDAPFLDSKEADWDRVVAVNLKGPWLMAREVARRMAEHAHGGRIVNIASVLGQTAASGVQGYAATKAGLIHLTRSLAVELARDDIRVNAISPGYVTTDLNRTFLEGEGGERVRKRVPLRRFGTPADLDGALMLLASDAGRYMTGAVITVDGGLTLSSL